ALNLLEAHLHGEATAAAEEAGAEDIATQIERDIRTARVEARDVFVEAFLTVEASGRPRIAHA
ncbi:MAG: hypothetical protein VX203_13745, partial [Pseudomonadota bacterium]|nr:hypothetical protein [Pseudomonadota bacterium]